MLNASTSYRLHSMGLTVDGDLIDFALYPFLPEIIDEHAPVITVTKGAQLGLTVASILRAIEGQLHDGLRGTGYFFPTDSEVQDFSKARFDPILEQYGLAANVNTAGLKEVGEGYVWFRAAGQKGGGQKSLSAVKSFPSDRGYLDEYDEMEPARVDAIRHRLDASDEKVRGEFGLSTPTIPEFGVHHDYQQSDMRSLFWRCDRCNERTCLEQTWPDCIATPSEGEPYYLCGKCREPLEKNHCEWIAKHPERSRFHRGYHISQLCSPRRSPGAILIDYDDSVRRGRTREFHNQVLALPYAEVDDQLDEAALNACVDDSRVRATRSEGPCGMGVDVGVRKLHYVVGSRTSDTHSEVLDYGSVSGFEEIAQIARNHNVQIGCMDIGAETWKVREFIEEHAGWYGVQYAQKRTTGYGWDPKKRVVTVLRNEALDASHQAIVQKRDSFPAKNEVWHSEFVPHMLNLARERRENEEGSITHRWVVTGGMKNDHLKHAHGYWHIALTRCAVAGSVQRARSSQRRRVKRGWMAA